MKLQMKESEAVVIEEGIYRAIIKSITAKQGKFGEILSFQFELLEEGLEGISLFGIVGANLTPTSKLNEWLLGLGIELQIGEEIDLNLLVNKTCEIWVENREDKSSGRIYSNVVKVRKLGSVKKNVVTATNGNKNVVTAFEDQRNLQNQSQKKDDFVVKSGAKVNVSSRQESLKDKEFETVDTFEKVEAVQELDDLPF